jgi:hypothetical protein
MSRLDLTDDDKAALIELLRETIASSRFLLSPRIRRLKAILDKLDPAGAAPGAAAPEAAGRAQHGADEDAAAVTTAATPRLTFPSERM